MVVYENRRRGRFADHRIIDFAGMHQGGGERALGHLYLTDLSVLIGEQHNVKNLAFLFFQPLAKMTIDLLGRAQGVSCWPLLLA